MNGKNKTGAPRAGVRRFASAAAFIRRTDLTQQCKYSGFLRRPDRAGACLRIDGCVAEDMVKEHGACPACIELLNGPGIKLKREGASLRIVP